jgi:hypothetical protein
MPYLARALPLKYESKGSDTNVARWMLVDSRA